MKKTLYSRSSAVHPQPPPPRPLWTRLGGLGLLALLGGVGFFASARPAHTVAGPVAVAVSNLPLPTAPADEAAPRQPFQANAYYYIASGSSIASLLTGYKDITVPAGKRLVIQSVSVYREGSGQGESVRTFISTNAAGTSSYYALPLVPDDGTAYPGATLTAVLSADPGSTVFFTGYRSGSNGGEYLYFSVSGYLVNVS